MRHEKVDTRAVLLGELRQEANRTDPVIRASERERVLAYWPAELRQTITDGSVQPPPWRLLVDPTRWHDVDPAEVHAYVWELLDHGRWPALDSLRKRFGRVSNHRGPDEIDEQEALFR